MKSKGLGDTIDKIIPPVIKKAVKFLFDDCGCEERRKKWNERVVYFKMAYFAPKRGSQPHFFPISSLLSSWNHTFLPSPFFTSSLDPHMLPTSTGCGYRTLNLTVPTH